MLSIFSYVTEPFVCTLISYDQYLCQISYIWTNNFPYKWQNNSNNNSHMFTNDMWFQVTKSLSSGMVAAEHCWIYGCISEVQFRVVQEVLCIFSRTYVWDYQNIFHVSLIPIHFLDRRDGPMGRWCKREKPLLALTCSQLGSMATISRGKGYMHRAAAWVSLVQRRPFSTCLTSKLKSGLFWCRSEHTLVGFWLWGSRPQFMASESLNLRILGLNS